MAHIGVKCCVETAVLILMFSLAVMSPCLVMFAVVISLTIRGRIKSFSVLYNAAADVLPHCYLLMNFFYIIETHISHADEVNQ